MPIRASCVLTLMVRKFALGFLLWRILAIQSVYLDLVWSTRYPYSEASGNVKDDKFISFA